MPIIIISKTLLGQPPNQVASHEDDLMHFFKKFNESQQK